MPIWVTLAYDAIKVLLTGVISRWWAARKQTEKAKDVADAPKTKQELEDYFK